MDNIIINITESPVTVTITATAGSVTNFSNSKSNLSLVGEESTPITFDNELGSSGSAYSLLISCYDSIGNNVDYNITSRTSAGFTIISSANCFFDYMAIKI